MDLCDLNLFRISMASHVFMTPALNGMGSIPRISCFPVVSWKFPVSKSFDTAKMESAVSAYRSGSKSLQTVSEQYGVNRGTLYFYAQRVENGIKLPSPIHVAEKLVPIDTWLRFLGWFLTEGCAPQRADRSSSYRVELSQRTDSSCTHAFKR